MYNSLQRFIPQNYYTIIYIFVFQTHSVPIISKMSSSKQLFFTLLVVMSLSQQALSSPAGEIHAVTSVRGEYLPFKWTIEDFDRLSAENGQYLDSPIFRTKTNDFGWKLRMYPKGVDRNAMGYMSLYLIRASDIDTYVKEDVRLNCRFSIYQYQNLQMQRSFEYTSTLWNKYGYDQFFPRSLLLGSNGYSGYGSAPFTIVAEINFPLRIVTGM